MNIKEVNTKLSCLQSRNRNSKLFSEILKDILTLQNQEISLYKIDSNIRLTNNFSSDIKVLI